MRLFNPAFSKTRNNSLSEPAPEEGKVQEMDLQCPGCLEACHIITFLQEIHQLEHAMLLTENDSIIAAAPGNNEPPALHY